jgi:Fe-S cluster biogenesis protein NfuA
MSGREQIDAKLLQLKPVLDSAGRGIEIVSWESPKATIKLTGFCGGCGCVSSYMDGMRDLLAEYCPEMTDVQFIES